MPKLARFSHVYIPLHHVGDPGHWTLARLQLSTSVLGPIAEVLHYDSIASPKRSAHAGATFKELVVNSMPGYQFVFRDQPSPQQQDTINCGVYVIINFGHLIFGNDLPQAIDPAAERNRLLGVLLSGPSTRMPPGAAEKASSAHGPPSMGSVPLHPIPEEPSLPDSPMTPIPVTKPVTKPVTEPIDSGMNQTEDTTQVPQLIASERPMIRTTPPLRKAKSRWASASTINKRCRMWEIN
ncbi:hypothetical protein ColLi_13263 [Colletotrichum liriopes]|uniref:Ubiquitin-like protease family profile domain-containing protein n=1 Tax=Colletotrichum liriopes TaxID=708192 RepID=A0AA37GZW6_9PEZI|nr:hypothetical protein ColLi_13263 [Colletotrichum liriopes]